MFLSVDNRYRIRTQIGYDAIGVIYHTVDGKTGTHIAIKPLTARSVSGLQERDFGFRSKIRSISAVRRTQ